MEFDNTSDTNLAELGEFGLIKHLTQHKELYQPSTIKGVGDDAAVINNEDLQTVISTDILIEGVHFDLGYTPLQHLGFKVVSVVLSDIAAMNAIPAQLTIGLGLSNRFSVESVDALYEGIKLACDEYKVDLVGGDTTSSPQG